MSYGVQYRQLAEGSSLQHLESVSIIVNRAMPEALTSGLQHGGMALSDPKSLREAGIPERLQHAVKGAITEWKISDWGRVDLSELFGGSLSLASALFEEGASRDLFTALVEVGAQGDRDAKDTDDIEYYFSGQDGKFERIAAYLATLSRGAHSSKKNGLFAYDQEASSCKLAAKWSTEATEGGSLQTAALRALQVGSSCGPKVIIRPQVLHCRTL